MTSSLPRDDGLERCNLTELLTVCRRHGFQLHPSTPREEMIRLLRGEDREWVADPIDLIRNGLIRLVQDHWRQLSVQLKCPAKELEPTEEEDTRPDPSHPAFPRACYRCPGAQVIRCLLDNKQHEQLINIRKRENENMNIPGALTIDNMPTEVAELAKLPGFKLNLLFKELFTKVNGPEAFEEANADFRAMDSAKKAAALIALRGELNKSKGKATKTAPAAGKFTGKAPAGKAAAPPEEEAVEAEGAEESEEIEETPKKFKGKGAVKAPRASDEDGGLTLEELKKHMVQAELASAHRETQLRELIEAQSGVLLMALAALGSLSGAEESLADWVEAMTPLAEQLRELSVSKKG